MRTLMVILAVIVATMFAPAANAADRNDVNPGPNDTVVVDLGYTDETGVPDGVADAVLVPSDEGYRATKASETFQTLAAENGYVVASWPQWRDMLTANSDVIVVPFVQQAKPVIRAEFKQPGPGVVWYRKAKVLVTAEQPENTVPTEKGAFYRVVKRNPRTDNQWTVHKDRLHAGEEFRATVKFPNAKHNMQVLVVSYDTVVARTTVVVD